MRVSFRKQRGTIAVLLVMAGSATLNAADRLDEARSAVSRWVDVERTISREALAWEDKKTLLNDLLAVAKAETEALKQRIAEAEKATGAAESRRAELVQKRDENEKLAAGIRQFVGGMEARLRKFVRQLPQPLVEKLNPLVQRMPADPAAAEPGIARRMQTVMGFVAEVQRFDTMVTVGEELRATAGGETREVRTIHFGLGAAYYVSADDADAGVGLATDTGWQWQSQPELAVTVRDAIAAANGREREVRFLALPVKLKEVAK